MAEAMSEAAEEQIRYIASMDAPGPFSEMAVGALRVALDEVDRLRAQLAEIGETRDLLGSISLYVNWRFTTKQLTTPQKELWADAVDEWSQALRIADGEDPQRVADRWWRDDA